LPPEIAALLEAAGASEGAPSDPAQDPPAKPDSPEAARKPPRGR
jgi:hypothetical protein